MSLMMWICSVLRWLSLVSCWLYSSVLDWVISWSVNGIWWRRRVSSSCCPCAAARKLARRAIMCDRWLSSGSIWNHCQSGASNVHWNRDDLLFRVWLRPNLLHCHSREKLRMDSSVKSSFFYFDRRAESCWSTEIVIAASSRIVVLTQVARVMQGKQLLVWFIAFQDKGGWRQWEIGLFHMINTKWRIKDGLDQQKTLVIFIQRD